MKPRLLLLFTAFAAASLPSVAQQPVSLATMQAALQFRAEIATAVAAETETPENALKRLRENSAASGLNKSRDADYGYASLDIAQRLLAMREVEAAEVFFRAAETGFEEASNHTPRGQAREKADYLRNLAHIRAKFLNKAAQARDDIDEAIRLQPEDKTLIETRGDLARGRSEHFKGSRGK